MIACHHEELRPGLMDPGLDRHYDPFDNGHLGVGMEVVETHQVDV